MSLSDHEIAAPSVVHVDQCETSCLNSCIVGVSPDYCSLDTGPSVFTEDTCVIGFVSMSSAVSSGVPPSLSDRDSVGEVQCLDSVPLAKSA